MKKANRLSNESSPYLQQHAHNPVDWYPWGPEALEKSKREQKPIFLSIGYSACHWCHVMERESFENEETAKLMNQLFINIKVDREERPDLDHIYMSAVQAMTQHGGWPMSVFLTPELEPFYGGTYFPPEDKMGMPSFKKILTGVANAWTTRRDEVKKSAKQLTDALKEIQGQHHDHEGHAHSVSLDLLDHAVQAIAGGFDPYHGGFGNQPKFFHTLDMRVCLRHWKRTGDQTALKMVTLTLDHLSRGGIYDQLGGGFHRYSTDQKWLVPHFEKMLYDNALLSELYLETYQATKNPEHANTARETLDYVLREMTSPEGAFFSTQDADTEGEEGKFYVWSREEIFKALDKELGGQFCQVFNVSESGNWEGKNILHRTKSYDEIMTDLSLDRSWLEDSLATAKRKLFSVRKERPAPFRDEKVLVSWNGLMIHSMALGYQVLGDDRFLDAARKAASFILENMGAGANGDGTLLHAYKDGNSKFPAYLDDYGALANALVSLYESDFDVKWLQAAKGLAKKMSSHFWDGAGKDFFYTAHNHEKLITRPKEIHDGATPSGTGLAVTALSRLGRILEDRAMLEKAEKTLESAAAVMSHYPTAAGQLLVTLGFLLDEPKEIVVVGGTNDEEKDQVLQTIRTLFLPNKVVALYDKRAESTIPLLAQKKSVNGQVTTYVCQNFSCKAPLVGPEAVEKELGK